MSHRIKPIIAWLAMTAIAVVTVAPVAAQNIPTAPNQRPALRLASLLNLEFKGGTAAEYIESIRKTTDEVNLVVLTDLASVAVPAVTLKSVDPGTALSLLESLPETQGNRRVRIQVRKDQATLTGNAQEGQWPVFTITAETSESRRSDARDSLVLQVGDVLDEQVKAADMLTAIEAALSMLEPEFPAAQIKFHEATALLIARGHPEQMGCVQRVVQQLRERKAIAEQAFLPQLDRLKSIESNYLEAQKEISVFRNTMEFKDRQIRELTVSLDAQNEKVLQLSNELRRVISSGSNSNRP